MARHVVAMLNDFYYCRRCNFYDYCCYCVTATTIEVAAPTVAVAAADSYHCDCCCCSFLYYYNCC